MNNSCSDRCSAVVDRTAPGMVGGLQSSMQLMPKMAVAAPTVRGLPDRSLQSHSDTPGPDDNGPDRGARSYFALTVTSITTSTLTVSVASTNSATTVSLSVYCTVSGGATQYPRC